MSEKWYNSEWFVLLVVAASVCAGIVSNYLSHGGHISW